jgi:putative spermidine/putrescine transport system permease protein
VKLTEPVYRTVAGGRVGFCLNVALGLVLLFLIAPIAVVAIISFSADPYLSFPPSGFSLRWYRVFFFGDPTWLAAASKSFYVASCTAILAVALGLPAAIPLVRQRSRGKGALELLLLAPLVVSPMVIAISLYGALAKFGLVGTSTGLIFGHTILALPYCILNIAVAVKSLDVRLEQAATSLGAGPFYVLRRVTVPLLLPGILAGGFFAFLVSFDDVVISLFLSGLDPTLQKRMWDEIRLEISPTVAAVSTLLVVGTALIFGTAILLRRIGWRSENGAANT